MDIGIQEIFLISIIALVVLGPERLPTAVRNIALWLGRLKRSFNDIKNDIEREINADEIRQQLHNETVLHELDKAARDLSSSVEAVEKEFTDLQDNATDEQTANTNPSQKNLEV